MIYDNFSCPSKENTLFAIICVTIVRKLYDLLKLSHHSEETVVLNDSLSCQGKATTLFAITQVTIVRKDPQRFQYPIIKEYTLNYNIKAPIN